MIPNNQRKELEKLAKRVRTVADKAGLPSVSNLAENLYREVLNSTSQDIEQESRIVEIYHQLMAALRDPNLYKEVGREMVVKLLAELLVEIFKQLI